MRSKCSHPPLQSGTEWNRWPKKDSSLFFFQTYSFQLPLALELISSHDLFCSLNLEEGMHFWGHRLPSILRKACTFEGIGLQLKYSKKQQRFTPSVSHCSLPSLCMYSLLQCTQRVFLQQNPRHQLFKDSSSPATNFFFFAQPPRGLLETRLQLHFVS